MKNKDKPIILINFKAARAGCGENAVCLARQIDAIQSDIPAFQVAVAVQPQDIYRIAQETSLRIYAQHVDPIYFGDYSGCICPQGVREAGAHGTLLNHPEKKVTEEVIEKTIRISRSVGLEVVLCVNSIAQGMSFNRYSPHYIGIECEDLIGKPVSLTNAYPQLVPQAISSLGTRIFFGAGIKTKDDVLHVLSSGCAGVIVSSVILKSDNPGKALKDLVSSIFVPTY